MQGVCVYIILFAFEDGVLFFLEPCHKISVIL